MRPRYTGAQTVGGEGRVSEVHVVSSILRHGAAQLPGIVVDSYNADLRDGQGFVVTAQAVELS
jgi:hypothetical protein